MKTFISILIFTLLISCSDKEKMKSEIGAISVSQSETVTETEIAAETAVETTATADTTADTAVEMQAAAQTAATVQTVKTPAREQSEPEIKNAAAATTTLPEEASQPEAVSEKVKTLNQEMCAISQKEINCYRRMLVKRSLSTLDSGTDRCFKDFEGNFGKLLQKMAQSDLSEAEKSDINYSLFVWKRLLKKFHNNQAQCKLQNHETPEKLFTYYDSIVADYLKEIQAKFCSSNL